MAFLFKEICEEIIIKANPYHDKRGRFTTKTGGAMFVPVDLSQPEPSNWEEAKEHIRRISGDVVTVGGVEYRDIGSNGYNEYLDVYGKTSDKKMDEDLQAAYDEAEHSYVGTGQSFTVNRWCRLDQDRDKYADYLVKERNFSAEDAAEEADILEREISKTIDAMDKVIAADTLKSDMMLTRMTDYSVLRAMGKDIDDALDRGADNNEIISLINMHQGQVMTEKGYMSTSMTGDINYFSYRQVRMGIIAKEGTPAFITDNYTESEAVLGRNTNLRLIGAQEIEGEDDRKIMVIYQIADDVKKSVHRKDVEKSSIRTPEMLTVEPAADSETERKKIILQMMGIDEEIKKFNPNHGADGRFCEAGANVTGDGGASATTARVSDEKPSPKTLGSNYQKQADEAIHSLIDPYLSKEDQKQMSDDLTRLWNSDKSALSMRVSPNTIEHILSDGVFKNQIETGTGAAVALEYRKKVSERLFGEQSGELESADYEKYGYFGSSDFRKDAKNKELAPYGSATVHFKKDSMDGRTTYTCRDSMFGMESAGIIGSNASNVAGFADSGAKEQRPGQYWSIQQSRKDYLHDTQDPADYGGSQYIELQYHGKLSINDVESVCFQTGDFPKREVVKGLMDKGIKVFKRTKAGKVDAVDEKFLKKIAG